jgi:predicted lysophospholipase L1 biosynthesis ABC-type transport system permease subunit
VKVTGLLVLLVGIAAALFTVVNAMSAKPADATKVGTAAANPDPGVPPVVIPLVVAVAGIGVGGGLLLFGSKGYTKEPNPAIRN